MNKKYLEFALIILIILSAGIILWRIVSDQPVANSLPSTTAGPEESVFGWLVARNDLEGWQFQYPTSFGANVWHPQFWPPRASVFLASQDPQSGCPDELMAEKHTQSEVEIGDRDYTLIKGEGIGAGSLFNAYCYISKAGNNNFVLYFSIWSHSGCGSGDCGAYCGTQFETECRNLNRVEQIEKPIEKMVSTFKF